MMGIPRQDRPEAPAWESAALSQRGALAVLILVELLAFSYMSETVVFPTIVGLAAIFGWQRPRRYHLSADRQVIMGLLAGVLFVVGWRVDPHHLPDDTMPYLSPFLHSLGQYLLVLQTAALYLRHERDVMPITLPWPGVFVMVSAGDINASDSQRATFQVIAILFMGATALYFSATAREATGQTEARQGFGKRAALALVLLAMAGGAWIGSTALHTYERELNRIVSEMLTPTVGTAGAGFPSRSELGSISERKTSQSQEIALRIFSSHRPGYWRGKVYHWLDAASGSRAARVTRWEDLPPPEFGRLIESPRDRRLNPDGRLGERYRYILADTANETVISKYEIWLEPPQWGVYFLPADAVEILSSEEQIISDFRKTVSPRGEAIVHYQVRAGATQTADAGVTPGDGDGVFSVAALTAVPRDDQLAGGDPKMWRLAESVFQDCRTFDEHIEAVETYFRTNYQYHEGIAVPANRDPIEWFLATKPPAHCEYFAQGAALLLRMRGIPTRYVTGFVVSERNDYGDYWLARNEDAHAWCEAWDPQRGWVLVEATPAAGIPKAISSPWHRQIWEYLSGALEQFRFRFAQGGWLWLAGRVWRFLLTPAGWLVLLLIFGYIVLRARMLLAARNPQNLPPSVLELHRLLRRMDRRLERGGLQREPGETLSRFARRVATETGDLEAAEWYASYAAARYGGRLGTGHLARLRERSATIRSRRRLSRMAGR